MKRKTRFVMLALAACYAVCCSVSGALAVEFKNIGVAPAVMYDAPSARGQKLFVAPRGMPVELVMSYGVWSKVRDFAGDLSWVETRQLAERKNILVRNLNAKIRASADDNSEVIFSADKGVLLEFVNSTTPGWVKVKHNDGAIGYVKLSDVWGA